MSTKAHEEPSDSPNFDAVISTGFKPVDNLEHVPAATTPTDQPKTVDVKKARKEFATLTNADIQRFTDILGSENVVQEIDEVAPYVMDFTKKYVGVGSVVLTPTTTEQVS